MEQRNQSQESLSKQGQHQNPLPHQISDEQKSLNQAALRDAEKDIAKDADLSLHSRNDDLDEGETARLGENVPV